MKKNLKDLVEEVGHKVPHLTGLTADFEKLSSKLAQHHIHLESKSLKKLMGYLTSKEKPSKKTLDRLALFAGFQNWKDLQSAIHGDNDGQLNYED
ncbi:hypothetical protein [Prevotella sp. HUN102]|uniref:hypothetical protein n=1 Tax=Prevotella sp. HUN102 TaxID=1392486 RepID=UPI00048B9F22|nr:hypothetical protein [Prevotella sp. HUN102]